MRCAWRSAITSPPVARAATERSGPLMQSLSFLTLKKLSVMAAVGTTAAAFSFACSSSSPAPSGAFDDAGATAANDSGEGEDVQDAAMAPLVPCDAALVLPKSSAAASACSQCLQTNCMPDLAKCEDCLCTSAVECLAANHNDYVNACPQALAAIGAGNVGLTEGEKK